MNTNNLICRIEEEMRRVIEEGFDLGYFFQLMIFFSYYRTIVFFRTNDVQYNSHNTPISIH